MDASSLRYRQAGIGSKSSSSLAKHQSSFVRLPSVTSASSFSTNRSSKALGPAGQHPWKPDKRQAGRRSVRWSEGGEGPGEKGDDPALLWARYTSLVMPQLAPHEPGTCARVKARAGGPPASSRLWLDADYHDNDDDGRYVKKLSLPCPAWSGCSLCVYSRQLGPVRVYFSALRRANRAPTYKPTTTTTTSAAAAATRGAAARTSAIAAVKQAQGAPGGGDSDSPGGAAPDVVFVKERWLRSSLPSGEVVVPEPPADPDPALTGNCPIGTCGGFLGRTEPAARGNKRASATRAFSPNRLWRFNHSTGSGPIRPSVPPRFGGLPRKTRHGRSVSFCCDSPVVNKTFRVPRNSPRS